MEGGWDALDDQRMSSILAAWFILLRRFLKVNSWILGLRKRSRIKRSMWESPEPSRKNRREEQTYERKKKGRNTCK